MMGSAEWEQGRDYVRALLSTQVEPIRRSHPMFAKGVITAMAELAIQDDQQLQDFTYRLFDSLDEILGIDFTSDEQMATVDSVERLYSGSGRGVQSSYTTILSILCKLRLPAGAHLMDLGSGFGRVGLTAGLWRDDIQFTGYEFVGHRVQASNQAARLMGIESRVRFVQQDLAVPDFKIPIADVYYMYDPFCVDTFRLVAGRLNQIAAEIPVAVVTKGDAGRLFLSQMTPGRWHEPEFYDYGNLLLIRGREITRLENLTAHDHSIDR